MLVKYQVVVEVETVSEGLGKHVSFDIYKILVDIVRDMVARFPPEKNYRISLIWRVVEDGQGK